MGFAVGAAVKIANACRCIAVMFVLAGSSAAGAAQAPDAPKSSSPQQAAKPPADTSKEQEDKAKKKPGRKGPDAIPDKEPPPPLFPSHRRGLYRNAKGEEVIDATPQSPPLDTDDPGTPDPGDYEINLVTHIDHTRETRRFDALLVDANYGVLPVIAGYKLPTQLKFEVPIVAAHEAGQPYSTGVGAAIAGIKFNFYDDDNRGIKVAVYPQLEFAFPGGGGVEKGLTEKGQTFLLPLLVSREFHEFTFVFNTELEKAIHDPDRAMAAEFGVGFGRALTRKDALMGEIRTESSLNLKDDRLVYFNIGYIHGVRNVIVYGNVGRSVFSDDGLTHTYAGVGIKLEAALKKKKSDTP